MTEQDPFDPNQPPPVPPPAYPPQPGAGYPPPGYPMADPSAPYGRDPFGRPLSNKSKLIAGLLQILIGGLGIGRFYTGYVKMGIAQIVVTVVTLGLGALWGFIDGILYLVKDDRTDAKGLLLRP